MARSVDLSTASRDAFLTLRRVERQQRLVEMLVEHRGVPVSTDRLARALGASPRSIDRDLARLRESGLPIRSRRGPGGGSWLAPTGAGAPLTLDVTELAALISTLVALGPTATDSAASAMAKLVGALPR
ncbi:HTH domain-containing protein [Tsukamurella sp. 8F]|uniref:helix-turn-helix transcriptional regulator n=1 Tax=unclassified Tsukamurella TaxID=2633480 RepID=UPI0023BA0446|nr:MULTISPECIES: HTH domain-containing protein [unclassified Tsukamurella]MDF0531596.1 HTH domain-containing protein [Tsukamurella sp. 8J]MDF0587557.1 HTH domain-containing protein [Tsukamurella sp. 8F]